MMKKLLLCSFLILLCFSGVGIADNPPSAVNYPRDGLLISPAVDDIPNNDIRPPVEKETDLRSLISETKYYLLSLYGSLIGIPSAFITETLSFLFILFGAGGLTFLLTRWKLPEDPNSRPRVLLNTIREHPGATQSELQKLTGHSRGSVSINLHHLSMTSKIRKRVQNGKSRYYLACTPDDEMTRYYLACTPDDERKGFLRKLTTQENPQKILEAIISNPGISQKELHETTGIPKTTLQWHLSQLAKYEAIQSTRERGTKHRPLQRHPGPCTPLQQRSRRNKTEQHIIRGKRTRQQQRIITTSLFSDTIHRNSHLRKRATQ